MSNARETLDFEQKHKEDLQRLRGFRLLDDDFMSKVFEDKEGVLTMCREMENMRKESSHEKAVEIAKRMLASGKLTYEDIAAFTDLTLEEIKALAVQKTA